MHFCGYYFEIKLYTRRLIHVSLVGDLFCVTYTKLYTNCSYSVNTPKTKFKITIAVLSMPATFFETPRESGTFSLVIGVQRPTQIVLTFFFKI